MGAESNPPLTQRLVGYLATVIQKTLFCRHKMLWEGMNYTCDGCQSKRSFLNLGKLQFIMNLVMNVSLERLHHPTALQVMSPRLKLPETLDRSAAEAALHISYLTELVGIFTFW